MEPRQHHHSGEELVTDDQQHNDDTPYPVLLDVFSIPTVQTEHRRAINALPDGEEKEALEDMDPVAERIADFMEDAGEGYVCEPPQVIIEKGAINVVLLAQRSDVAADYTMKRASIQGAAQYVMQQSAQEQAQSMAGSRHGIALGSAAELADHDRRAQGGPRGIFGAE
jgi:hypothetical protein